MSSHIPICTLKTDLLEAIKEHEKPEPCDSKITLVDTIKNKIEIIKLKRVIELIKDYLNISKRVDFDTYFLTLNDNDKELLEEYIYE
jgi:hypothetical protein